MIVWIILIVALLLFVWVCSNATDNDNNNEKQKEMQMTETDIRLAIIALCEQNDFIKKPDELKIYSPTEKDKDDFFDEVFEIKSPLCKAFTTRCVQNIKNGEEITVVIPLMNDVYVGIYNKLYKYEIPNIYCDRRNLCYSKQEIEKIEITKQIAKLNIPSYIRLDFCIETDSLHFWSDYDYMEDLTISAKELSKEKILQNIEECKKRYAQKHEKSYTIRKQIQSIFNEN